MDGEHFLRSLRARKFHVDIKRFKLFNYLLTNFMVFLETTQLSWEVLLLKYKPHSPIKEHLLIEWDFKWWGKKTIPSFKRKTSKKKWAMFHFCFVSSSSLIGYGMWTGEYFQHLWERENQKKFRFLMSYTLFWKYSIIILCQILSPMSINNVDS